MPPPSPTRATAAGGRGPLRPRDEFAEVGRCRSTGRNVRLCYNRFGSAKDPCVVLVMGLASVGLLWDDRLCTALSQAGPYYVIRFDNRDVGCSTHFEVESENPSGAVAAASAGSAQYLRYAYAVLRPGRRTIPEVYTLNDMAADTFGLLDVLQVQAAHLVGTSMGGAIAQCMALAHPERVLSLTLLSTHSNALEAQWPSLRDMLSLLRLMPRSVSAAYADRIAQATNAEERQRLCAARDAERVDAYAIGFTKLLEKLAGNTRKYPFDRAAAHRQMKRIFQRSLSLHGGPRQFLALLNAPSRDLELRQHITSVAPTPSANVAPSSVSSRNSGAAPLYLPTIIIQGDCDILVPAANGKHLASVIPGSRLYMVEGMGHTLIPALRDTYVRLIRGNIQAGEAAARLPGRRSALQAAAAAATARSARSPAKVPSRITSHL